MPFRLHALLYFTGFIAVLVHPGCARNIILADHARLETPSATRPTVIRVYYDRDGDLYPAPFVRSEITNDQLTVDVDWKLERHFHRARCCGGSDVWETVLTQLRLDSTANQDALWEDVQRALVRTAAEEIKTATSRSGGRPRTLVILIHGFNNEPGEASASYATATEKMVSKYNHLTDAVFLEVYWDGLKHLIGLPVWGGAQFNFPLVGLSFRRLLNAVPKDVPVRILTHSSGGPLISNTLWNASGGLPYPHPDWPRYHRYEEYKAATTGDWRMPTHPDLRVAMVAPAMPGTTFSYFPDAPSGPNRIVIGVNPRDFAITKSDGLLVPKKWLQFWRTSCAVSGSTCLGSERDDYCQTVRDAVRRRLETRLVIFDFSEPRSGKMLWWFDRHDLNRYLERDDMPRLLSHLFDADPADEGDEVTWCRE